MSSEWSVSVMTPNGRVYVNARHVQAVRPGDTDGSCSIELASGQQITAEHPPMPIAHAIFTDGVRYAHEDDVLRNGRVPPA